MKYYYYHFNDMKRRPPKAAVSSPFFQHCLPLFRVSLFLLSCLLSQNFLVIIWMYCFQLYVLRKYVSGYQRHTNDSYLHVFFINRESYNIVGYFTLAFAFIQECMSASKMDSKGKWTLNQKRKMISKKNLKFFKGKWTLN